MANVPAALAEAPKYYRAAKATGSAPRVDREGGNYGAGLISQVAVITVGEALGHEAWIDETFLQQVKEELAEEANGVKSRWTHPDMSSDGMGKMTSRIMDPQLSSDGKKLLADQHFLKIGHKSPDGDLAGYQMDLADEDPSAYGLSIVFTRDRAATELFSLENTDKDGRFKSPDKNNVNNYEHVRLAHLHAADAVDDPAANPSGLFAREKDIAREADAVAAFALGLSTERPAVMRLGLDPERVRGFASRFLATHQLTLEKKAMADAATDTPADDATQTTPTDGGQTTKPADGATNAEPEANSARKEAARFHKAFGDQGAVWFAQGVSFEEAQQKANDALSDRLTAIEAQLAAGAKVTGEGKAAGFSGEDGKQAKGIAGKLRFSGRPAK